jgi:HPt (histidine-containing phosphotransfer) domain-containing protein
VHLAEIAAAIVHHDWHKLEYAAHHIKGTTANLGLTSMAAIASELEHQAKAKSFQQAETQLLKLQGFLTTIRVWLSKHP